MERVTVRRRRRIRRTSTSIGKKINNYLTYTRCPRTRKKKKKSNEHHTRRWQLLKKEQSAQPDDAKKKRLST